MIRTPVIHCCRCCQCPHRPSHCSACGDCKPLPFSSQGLFLTLEPAVCAHVDLKGLRVCSLTTRVGRSQVTWSVLVSRVLGWLYYLLDNAAFIWKMRIPGNAGEGTRKRGKEKGSKLASESLSQDVPLVGLKASCDGK